MALSLRRVRAVAKNGQTARRKWGGEKIFRRRRRAFGGIDAVALVIMALVTAHIWKRLGGGETNDGDGHEHRGNQAEMYPKIYETEFSVQRKMAVRLEESPIAARGECLRRIRQRQEEALGDVFAKEGRGSANGGVNKKILLVDPAYLSNVGDNMLSLGALEYFHSKGYDTDYSGNAAKPDEAAEVPRCHFQQAGGHRFPPCGNMSSFAHRGVGIAAWHAGGNWGDIWNAIQQKRIPSFYDILRNNFTLVQMPQSLHYNSETVEAKETRQIRAAIAAGLGLDVAGDLDEAQSQRRVVFAWREEGSLARAKELYPFADNRLVPDIALQLGPFNPIPPDVSKGQNQAQIRDILLFLRNDKESKFRESRNDKAIQELLDSMPSGKGRDKTFRIVDWRSRERLFGLSTKRDDDEYLFTSTAVRLVSLGRVAVVDRLHAAILCYISNVPFIYLDQITKKINKTLSVAFASWAGCADGEKGMFASASTMKESLEKAISMLERGNSVL